MKMNMSRFLNCSFAWAVALTVLAAASPVLAADKTEDQLIADLSSPKESVVTDALMGLEKKYPTSTKALPMMKKLLADDRMKVRRKAARVIGILHAPVDSNDVKAICTLLKSSDPATVTDGLKSLRGLKAPEAVPDVVALLKSSDTHLMRDACRTLAVIGNKDVIPSIEPLLNYPLPAVQKDAQDAIAALKSKS